MKFTAMLQFFWIILCVQGGEYPRVSFLGESLLNHSYVNLSLVGDGVNDVECLTDLVQCCSATQGNYRGDWWFPNGNRLEFFRHLAIFERRFNRTVVLRKSQSLESLQVGIYRCSIPTTDVHDADNINDIRALFYVGLYADGGNISILGEMNLTFHSVDIAAFTLTCISTGGPATTVIWTRDSIIITDGNKTVLNDPVTARYTHTLTVTGGRGWIYQCNVTNNKPSWAAKSITISSKANQNVGANPVQRLWVTGVTQTSLIFSWTATNQSAPLATGYRLKCVSPAGDVPPPNLLNLSISSTEMTGLLLGVVYNCCLTVTGLLSDSKSVCVTNSTLNNSTNGDHDIKNEVILVVTTSLFLIITILTTAIVTIGLMLKCRRKVKSKFARKNVESEVNRYSTTENTNKFTLTNAFYRRFSTHNKGSAEPHGECGPDSIYSTPEQCYRRATSQGNVENHENVKEKNTEEKIYENVASHQYSQSDLKEVNDDTITEKKKCVIHARNEQIEDQEAIDLKACNVVYDYVIASPNNASKQQTSSSRESEAVYANTSFHTVSENETYY